MKRTVEDIKKLWMQIEMPDGRLFAVPVMAIAKDRAENYKEEFDNDVEKSLAEDTLPLFAESQYEISDWAANNMNWSDVEDLAREIETLDSTPDYQEGWMNGHKSYINFNEEENT